MESIETLEQLQSLIVDGILPAGEYNLANEIEVPADVTITGE